MLYDRSINEDRADINDPSLHVDVLRRSNETFFKPALSINDIILPEQNKSIHELVLDVDGHSTANLISSALEALTWLGQKDLSLRLLPAPKKIIEPQRMDSYKLFHAMLGSVKSEGAKRYVTAATVTCGYNLERHIRLANTWFGLFLWPFRFGESAEPVLHSDGATPTYREADAYMSTSEDYARMKKEVRARDDFTCVVTGDADLRGPYRSSVRQPRTLVPLDCVHIVKRSMGVRLRSTSHGQDSASLLDILTNLFPFAAHRLKNSPNEIDTPINCMMLSANLNAMFESFAFCLEPWPADAPQPNTYKANVLRGHFFPPRASGIAVFEDHSHKHSVSGNKRVDHPEPSFFDIHATVAHIMHLSGAGDFISLLRRDFGRSCPGLFRSKSDANLELDALAVAFALIDLPEYEDGDTMPL